CFAAVVIECQLRIDAVARKIVANPIDQRHVRIATGRIERDQRLDELHGSELRPDDRRRRGCVHMELGNVQSDRIESGGAGVNAGRKLTLATKVQLLQRATKGQRRSNWSTTLASIFVRDVRRVMLSVAE